MSVSAATTLVAEILEPYETVSRASKQRIIRDVWASYWNTQYASSEFWFAYSQYVSKLEDLKWQIGQYSKDDRSPELFIGAVKRLEAYFDVVYIQNQVNNLLSLSETFNIIHLASAIVPASSDGTIEIATIKSIVNQLEELIGQLNETDLDLSLKKFLGANFSFLRWAAANYETLGVSGLSKAYGMVASEFMRAWGRRDQQDTASEGFWQSARKKLKLIGEGVIWTEKIVAGSEKLIGHVDDIAGLLG
jgi:hypothetical protein